jgi:hypothetical protein
MQLANHASEIDATSDPARQRRGTRIKSNSVAPAEVYQPANTDEGDAAAVPALATVSNGSDAGLGGLEFMASPSGSRVVPVDVVGQHDVVNAAQWNDDASSNYEGTRARRLEQRFNKRKGLGGFATFLDKSGKLWTRAMEKLGIVGGIKIGNAGVGWMFRDMIKELGSNFGGGVAAFFKFLKYLILVNAALFLVEFFFVVVPGFISWPAIKRRQVVAANLTCYKFNDSHPFIPVEYSLANVSKEQISSYYQAVYQADAFEDLSEEFVLKNYLDGKGVMGSSPIFFGGYVAKLPSGYRTDVAYTLTFIVCSAGLLFSVVTKAFKKDRTVRGFRQKFTLEDAIGSHTCSLEANTRVTNGIPLGSSLFLPVGTVNCVQTLKVLLAPSSSNRAPPPHIQLESLRVGIIP